MSKLFGVVLNVLFVYLMYMSYTYGSLWENGFNLMLTAYILLTLVCAAGLWIGYYPEKQMNTKGLEMLRLIEKSTISASSILFFSVATPMAAFIGYFGVVAILIINFIVLGLLHLVAIAQIEAMTDLAKSLNMELEDMLKVLDNKE